MIFRLLLFGLAVALTLSSWGAFNGAASPSAGHLRPPSTTSDPVTTPDPPPQAGRKQIYMLEDPSGFADSINAKALLALCSGELASSIGQSRIRTTATGKSCAQNDPCDRVMIGKETEEGRYKVIIVCNGNRFTPPKPVMGFDKKFKQAATRIALAIADHEKDCHQSTECK